MKAGEVAKKIESIAPISSGMAGDELGFVFGNSDVEVRGVAVCWSPTLDVILQVEKLGCNMILPRLFISRSQSSMLISLYVT